MKVTICEENCICCGQCEATAPEVFEVNDVANVVGKVNESNIEDVKLAASGCPTNAILVEEEKAI